MIDSNIRERFPFYKKHPTLVYLDNAATALKPQEVIDAEVHYYTDLSSNVHRGIYELAERATAAYERVRHTIAELINAKSHEEIVFTSGTTAGCNILANGLAQKLRSSQRIVTTQLEHHSNFVPWQQAARRAMCEFVVVPVRRDGFLEFVSEDGKLVNMSLLTQYVTSNTSVFAMSALSNTLGTVQPIQEIVSAVKKISPDCIVVIDAAQAVSHLGISVQDMGADFVVFSGHKIFGPTGTGVLWGDRYALDLLPPSQFGGEMVAKVMIDETIFKRPPLKFEAGTPHIAGVIGMGEAAEFIMGLKYTDIAAHETVLVRRLIDGLSQRFGDEVNILGTKNPLLRAGLVSFTMKNCHAHDIAQILDENGVCVRAGHHCAMPLHAAFGIAASVRASFSVYNTEDDVDRLLEALERVKKIL